MTKKKKAVDLNDVLEAISSLRLEMNTRFTAAEMRSTILEMGMNVVQSELSTIGKNVAKLMSRDSAVEQLEERVTALEKKVS